MKTKGGDENGPGISHLRAGLRVFHLFFLFALWLHVFYFCEIDVNRTKRDKEAVHGTYFAFVLHSFPSSSGMHIAKYAFYASMTLSQVESMRMRMRMMEER